MGGNHVALRFVRLGVSGNIESSPAPRGPPSWAGGASNTPSSLRGEDTSPQSRINAIWNKGYVSLTLLVFKLSEFLRKRLRMGKCGMGGWRRGRESRNGFRV